jgi:hypothetical protein
MKNEKEKQGTKNKIGFRGQFSARGLNSRSLIIWTWTEYKPVDLKKLTKDFSLKNIEFGFTDSGQHVD